MAPVSLLTSIMVSRMVSGATASSTRSQDTVPSFSGGTRVTWNPSCSKAFRVSRVALCSIWVLTIVPAEGFSLPGGALDGGVDALGAAGGEDHLLRFAPQRPGHLPPGLLHGFPGLFAHGMESGGVAVILPHQAEGGLGRFLQHLSGGTVIQIVDVFHYLLPLPKLSFRVTARLKTRWPSPLSRLSAQK